jgi:hypothetical protein
MYCTKNFKSKKELKAAVAAYLTLSPIDGQRQGPAVRYWQPGPFGGNEPADGRIFCEGPHYPEPHRWYAECVAEGGAIVKVK